MKKKISIIILAIILIVGVLSFNNRSFAAENETTNEITNEIIEEPEEETVEESIVITNTQETIEVDEEVKINFTASGDVTWKSSNTAVATVDKTGKVKGVKAGTATITGTVGEKSATCKITVKEKEVIEELEWTDASKAKVTLKRDESEKTFYHVYLNISGIKMNEKHLYFSFITNSTSKPTLKLDSSGSIDNINTKDIVAQNSDSTMIDEIYANNGEMYYWLCEQQYNKNTNKYENKFIIEAKKIERIPQNKLGNRLNGYFFNYGTSMFMREPRDTDNKFNIKVKIGRITDTSILLSIKNGESDCLQKLLDYAKSAKAIYTGNIALGDSEAITGKFDIVNKGYYYVYMQLDDENGKYYPVEDVSLYQGLVDNSSSVGKNLFDYLSDQFKWNLGDEPATPARDNTVAGGNIPQTGENTIIFISIVGVISLGVFAIIKYRRNNI